MAGQTCSGTRKAIQVRCARDWVAAASETVEPLLIGAEKDKVVFVTSRHKYILTFRAGTCRSDPRRPAYSQVYDNRKTIYERSGSTPTRHDASSAHEFQEVWMSPNPTN